MEEKKPIFSVTEKDLIVQTFHAGGPGGQNQNKRNTGVRIIHKESGAVGEARDSRSQLENKRSALKRMVETFQFKFWVKKITSEMRLGKTSEEIVNESMDPKNIKVEFRDETGKWVEEERCAGIIG
jgi:protein subunit release factor B